MKRFLGFILTIVCIISLVGCGDSEAKKVDTAAKSANEIIAINAGEVQVYLDEAMYYAYTSQATYETLFISEGKEIDWNSEMKEGVSWQQGVKSTVLDDICRRECMYMLADEYNVSLKEEDINEIDSEVNNFFKNSSEKLISRINIEPNRLKFVFEKQKIAKKVEEIMMATDETASDKTYEKWKDGNTVTAEEQWENITFDEPIFRLEDIENE